MSISYSEVQKLSYLDAVILHSHDQSLYLVSVIIKGEEHYVKDKKGNFLKSFNKLELQTKFSNLQVGKVLLRHQSPYDEMIGLPQNSSDNTLEVELGGEQYASPPDRAEKIH